MGVDIRRQRFLVFCGTLTMEKSKWLPHWYPAWAMVRGYRGSFEDLPDGTFLYWSRWQRMPHASIECTLENSHSRNTYPFGGQRLLIPAQLSIILDHWSQLSYTHKVSNQSSYRKHKENSFLKLHVVKFKLVQKSVVVLSPELVKKNSSKICPKGLIKCPLASFIMKICSWFNILDLPISVRTRRV